MFMQSKSTAVPLLPSRVGCVPVSPKRVVYERWQGMVSMLHGTIVENLPVIPRGYPGVLTFDYRIVPDPGCTNLSSHWVSESAVQWNKTPVCRDCGGHGFTRIVGDDDQPCHCNDDVIEVLSAEVQF